METTPFELKKKRTTSEIFSDTFEFIRLYIKPLIISLLVIAGPLLLLGSVFFSFFSTYRTLRYSADIDTYTIVGNMLLGLILLMLGNAMSISVVLAFLKLVAEGIRKPTVKEVWEFSKPYLGKFIVITILLGLIIGAIFLLMALFSSLFVASAVSGGPVGIIIIVVLILTLGIVYVISRLSLSYCAGMFDDLGPGSSIGRSWDYTGYKFWQSTGVLVLSYLIAFVISYIVRLPILLYTYSQTFMPGAIDNFQTYLIVALSSFGLFVGSLLTGIPNISLALHYYNVQERREGTGLLERIEQIDIQPENKNWGEETY
jgi:hypothetical protein